jgi:class 3 adenylate cyclase
MQSPSISSLDMPHYLDIHDLHGPVDLDELARAHAADVEVQKKYGVNYLKYWVNESRGKVFCLVEAPNPEAANRVHREAHGLVAQKLIEIDPDLADGYLGGGDVSAIGAVLMPGGSATARDPAIRTILFTDIVESTALTQSLGDDAAMQILNLHNRVVRNALTDSGGREVKHTGDGIMASFVSAAAAVKCAAQVQRDIAAHEENRDQVIRLRIGAAAGEPVEEHDDLFGCTVQLAARLCARAEPEQILVSHGVVELCLGKKFRFEEAGELSLKGFAQPIRAHAVMWAAAG